MSYEFAAIARKASVDGTITADEVLALRQSGWADGRMDQEEAEIIFATQRAIDAPGTEWTDFFVEAIQNFVLNGSDPKGFASAEESQWLIGEIEKDGRVCSMTELELLVRIIERAQNVAETLKTYTLGVLEKEVLEGHGPTRDGGKLDDSRVTETEAKLIRRVIFGSGGDRPAAVSKREAEMLFRVKDASRGADNAPDFKRLFVQGVGNYLMGFASASGQISRERRMELDKFVADNSSSVGGFIGRMAKSAPTAFGVVFGKRDAPSREEQAAEDAEVTGIEQEWLDAQIAANGEVDEYDQALLEFIAEETGEA
ncbi:hypothetical protein [Aurantiacibacter gangjinensis]|uniref:Uncharacterized protein n=1 Tax=Aurantiacibacter gangjinensis TaxID=502682 RepID=A0A0G9MLF3_9SPHN|nr:hypothetical protein [Aurantiacibacter gangjinensis]APE27459.1 hypothetical protein BMF35_a0630 [Aurantiacibacter gangjinensis]KLE31527.1 hypothetical protein AAW01_08135 [Aurantiacibacter gangjinensis]